MEIQIIQGSILDVEAQIIVNAANSSCMMGDGIAGVTRRAAGSAVEQGAMQQAPIGMGTGVGEFLILMLLNT